MRKIFRELFYICVAIVIAVGFRSFLYEPFSIPSSSMVPNLLVGDHLLASKYSYGYSRYSLPFAKIPFQTRTADDAPKRGDIAVFRPPHNVSVDFVKRVIGLPGDKVQISRGRLYINNVVVPREYIQQDVHTFYNQFTESWDQRSLTLYKETLPNGVSYIIGETSDKEFVDNTPVYTVPEGHYFMMGDNRDSSEDSRFLSKTGYVPLENFIGKPAVVMFSIDRLKGVLFNPLTWPGAIVWKRTFHLIQ